jgi:hypothetical protein
MKLKDVVIEALIKVRLGTTAGESHSFVLTFNGEQVGGALRYLEQWWPELRDRLAAHITGVLVGSSHTFFEGAMWVSMAERTPEKEGHYLVYFPANCENYGNTETIDVCWWGGPARQYPPDAFEGGFSTMAEDGVAPTHWRELPAAPA